MFQSNLLPPYTSLVNNFNSFDGVNTKVEASSTYPHAYTGLQLGSYRNSPFVTGSIKVTGKMAGFSGFKTEILNYATSTWVEEDDYPFSDNSVYVKKQIFFYDQNIFRISWFSSVSTSESVLIIGGWTMGYQPSDQLPHNIPTIAEYKDGKWNKIGDLIQSRHRHGALLLGSSIMIVGGIRHDGPDNCNRCP